MFLKSILVYLFFALGLTSLAFSQTSLSSPVYDNEVSIPVRITDDCETNFSSEVMEVVCVYSLGLILNKPADSVSISFDGDPYFENETFISDEFIKVTFRDVVFVDGTPFTPGDEVNFKKDVNDYFLNNPVDIEVKFKGTISSKVSKYLIGQTAPVSEF